MPGHRERILYKCHGVAVLSTLYLSEQRHLASGEFLFMTLFHMTEFISFASWFNYYIVSEKMPSCPYDLSGSIFFAFLGSLANHGYFLFNVLNVLNLINLFIGKQNFAYFQRLCIYLYH